MICSKIWPKIDRPCVRAHSIEQPCVYNGTLGSGYGQKFQPANDPFPPIVIAA